MHGKLGADTARTGDPQLSEGIFPECMTLTWREARRTRECLELGSLPLQLTIMHDGTQFSWRWLNTYQSMGRGK